LMLIDKITEKFAQLQATREPIANERTFNRITDSLDKVAVQMIPQDTKPNENR